jgi:hypothetical protein
MNDKLATQVVSQYVSPTDLNLDWFEDKDLATDLSQDCLRLFQATESSFDEVRRQAWYKRVWSTVSGGNTRKLAQGCASLAQAQQLLLTVLQTHAKASKNTNLLLMLVARGLRYLEGQQSQVVATIVNMADRVELLEKEVDIHRRMIDGDPADEATWNQEQRLLLFRVMTALAGPSASRSQSLNEILSRRLDDLELQGDYLAEAIASLAEPQGDFRDDLDHIDSYQMRLRIYRNGFAIAATNQRKRSRSVLPGGIAGLAEALQIRARDRDKVAKAFASIPQNDAAAFLAVISAGARRGRPTPDREEYVEIDSRRKEMARAAQEKAATIDRARSELARLGPTWAKRLGDLISTYMVLPVFEIWDSYEPSKYEEVEEIVAGLSADAILARVNERIPEARSALEELVEQYNKWRPLPPALYRRAEEVWGLAVKDDGGWQEALSELDAAGTNLIAAKPSGIGQALKGGALGYAAGALLGPLGILAGIAAGAISDNSVKEDYDRAIDRWNSAAPALIEATRRWQETAQRHLCAYFDDLVAAIDHAIETGGAVCDPMEAVSLMESDMASDEEEGTKDTTINGS